MFDRLKNIGLSESMEITRLAKEMKSLGQDVITLSIGDTHFSSPKPILNAAKAALENNKTHYLDACGLEELRERIDAVFFNERFTSKNILIVPGVKQGLFYLLSSVDVKTVCVLEPAWLGYKYIAELLGKEYVFVNIKNSDWKEQLIQKKFDALIYCSPNNPDGTVFQAEDIGFILDLAKKNNAYLIADEIYSNYSYEQEHCSLSGLTDYKKIFILNGFSKSHAMTGLRIGFIASKDSEAMYNMLKMQQHIATCPNSVGQYAALGFDSSKEIVESYKEYYLANRNSVAEIFPEFQEFLPPGGFYFFVNLEHLGIKNALDFCKKLLQEKNVAVVPGLAYGKDFANWIRVSFSLDRKILLEGIKRVKSFILDN